MSLICPISACKKTPGMCTHDKIVGAIVLTLAALLIHRLTF